MINQVTISTTETQTHNENWARADTHCPACGSKSVWRKIVAKTVSFFIDGRPHICAECGVRYLLSELSCLEPTQKDLQRLESLRSAA
jgi:predicted RNA-binding Zn-ribbon protein involved in translation (DUF1610 family)